MSITLKQINREVVNANETLREENKDKRPIKGEQLFKEIYANIFLCAKKKSGKTNVIAKIVKECTTTDTTVLVFCSTVDKDPTHISIKGYCKQKGIPYVGYTSMKEDGIDILDELIKKLQEESKPDDDNDEEDEKPRGLVLFESSDDEEDEPKRKNKYRSPEYMIIFDDISNELKSKVLTKLCKMNRHWHMKIIISSQYVNDVLPETLKQMDYWLIFKGMSDDKLIKIKKDADLSLDQEQFDKIYHHATIKPFSFLYIDQVNEKFRRNFNMEYNLK